MIVDHFDQLIGRRIRIRDTETSRRRHPTHQAIRRCRERQCRPRRRRDRLDHTSHAVPNRRRRAIPTQHLDQPSIRVEPLDPTVLMLQPQHRQRTRPHRRRRIHQQCRKRTIRFHEPAGTIRREREPSAIRRPNDHRPRSARLQRRADADPPMLTHVARRHPQPVVRANHTHPRQTDIEIDHLIHQVAVRRVHRITRKTRARLRTSSQLLVRADDETRQRRHRYRPIPRIRTIHETQTQTTRSDITRTTPTVTAEIATPDQLPHRGTTATMPTAAAPSSREVKERTGASSVAALTDPINIARLSRARTRPAPSARRSRTRLAAIRSRTIRLTTIRVVPTRPLRKPADTGTDALRSRTPAGPKLGRTTPSTRYKQRRPLQRHSRSTTTAVTVIARRTTPARTPIRPTGSKLTHRLPAHRDTERHPWRHSKRRRDHATQTTQPAALGTLRLNPHERHTSRHRVRLCPTRERIRRRRRRNRLHHSGTPHQLRNNQPHDHQPSSGTTGPKHRRTRQRHGGLLNNASDH